MQLSELAPGKLALIEHVHGEDELAGRLLEMGLIEGNEIKLLRKAPLGDPLELEVCGYRVSLRKTEAARVTVRLALDQST